MEICIDSARIEAGLLALNPDFHFDMPNKLSEAEFMMVRPDRPVVNLRFQGVYHNGNHICAMDRGFSPELKRWAEEDGLVEISAGDVDRHENVHTIYMEILPSDPLFHEALLRAQAKSDQYSIDPRGKVFRWQHLVMGKVRGECIKVGWRHTFEAILRENIHGVTRESLKAVFGVDMYKYPVGPPEEVVAALVDE